MFLEKLESRGACLMSCWGRGPATGSQSPAYQEVKEQPSSSLRNWRELSFGLR